MSSENSCHCLTHRTILRIPLKAIKDSSSCLRISRPPVLKVGMYTLQELLSEQHVKLHVMLGLRKKLKDLRHPNGH
jgi:hypothetical protein